jgi:tetratricopeptide (TPR) repeat protein
MRRFLAIAAVVLAMSSLAHAEEYVYVKGKEKPLIGNLSSESGQGITLKAKGSLNIAADEIVDVVYYDVTPTQVGLSIRNKALVAEKESADAAKDAAKRKDKLAEAIKTYQDALGQLKGDQKSLVCHLEYKVAVLLARQAQEFGGSAESAMARLSAFKAKHANSWQITSALKTLAQLQLEQKQYDNAEETYKELAAAKVAEDTRQEAELLAALVTVRAGKHELAHKKLQALIARLPKDSKQAGRARIAQAECLIAAKRTDEATRTLREIVKETTDKTMKAAAYNTLGASLFAADRFKEARWEFLWVDVVYNQDRDEHAKALYYLWKTFSALGEADRAQECLESLLNDRQFTGTEYQHKAKVESAKASS